MIAEKRNLFFSFLFLCDTLILQHCHTVNAIVTLFYYCSPRHQRHNACWSANCKQHCMLLLLLLMMLMLMPEHAS